MKRSTIVILVILLVLILDQSLKIWVKTHMEYSEEIPFLGKIGMLHFVENNGMAFGVDLGGRSGKLALSLFRILAVGVLGYYIKQLLNAKASTGLLLSFGLILAGAIGNILDSAFYGVIFSASPFHGGLAEMFPPEGGYSSFLHGKVVDMLYFPLFDGHFPEWVPYWGGDYFQFFRPVFNIADTAITTGVLSIILFHRKFFSAEEELKRQEAEKAEEKTEAAEELESKESSEPIEKEKPDNEEIKSNI